MKALERILAYFFCLVLLYGFLLGSAEYVREDRSLTEVVKKITAIALGSGAFVFWNVGNLRRSIVHDLAFLRSLSGQRIDQIDLLLGSRALRLPNGLLKDMAVLPRSVASFWEYREIQFAVLEHDGSVEIFCPIATASDYLFPWKQRWRSTR
jgi:hypothetical protein